MSVPNKTFYLGFDYVVNLKIQDTDLEINALEVNLQLGIQSIFLVPGMRSGKKVGIERMH